MQWQSGRYSWPIYALISVGIVGVLMLAAMYTAHLAGSPVDWAVDLPIAILVAAGSVSAAVYGNHRSDRR